MSSASAQKAITVESIMITDVIVVTGEMTVLQAIGLMLDKKISGAPIVDTLKHVISIASESDLMKVAATAGLSKTISACLDQFPTKVITIKKTASFTELYRLFLAHPIHRIVVIDDAGRLLGLVSRSTVLRVLYGDTKD
jgi:predicted transcriptional regulator